MYLFVQKKNSISDTSGMEFYNEATKQTKANSKY